MYDWANSAMITIIVTAVYPIYFVEVACAGVQRAAIASQRHAIATTIALSIVAVLAPVLGAIADHSGLKKRLLGAFMGLGVAAVCAMFFIREGNWLLAATLFILANVGASGSFVFYDSLLPHIARGSDMDRLSASAYALGYLGGGLLLALSLLCIMKPGWFGLPEGTLAVRISFVAVGIWWLVFSVPLFLRVPEPAANRSERSGRLNPVAAGFRRLVETFRELRNYRDAFLFLVAFLLYNDGIGTIYRLATTYGKEMGLSRGALIGAVLMVQFVGIPCAFGFGLLAGKIGAKRCVYIGLLTYVVICLFGYKMYETRRAIDFYALALLVAAVQGGTQALSRSLFASMIPQRKSSEFFAFFAVVEKFAGIFGPAIYGLIIGLTGSSQKAILFVVAFFIVGGLLLTLVRVERGQRAAAAMNAKMEENRER